MWVKLFLMFSLFALFYALFIGEYPDSDSVKEKVQRYLLPGVFAICFFILGRIVFLSALSGLILAILGYFVPKWYFIGKEKRRMKRPKSLVKDFITGAAGIYGSGQLTEAVIRHSANRFPEPFASEFKEMLGRRALDKNATYPTLLREMAVKYSLNELYAVATIIEASEQAGGAHAAARGLKKLSIAIQKQDKLKMEREKANIEPKIACIVGIFILGAGLVMDVTLFRDLYAASKITLAIGIGIVVGLIFAVMKISQDADLQ